jgi:hypothetical protein
VPRASIVQSPTAVGSTVQPVSSPGKVVEKPRTAQDASKREEGQDQRHAARRILWRESSLERVKSCGHDSVMPEGRVALRCTAGQGGERIAGWSGLATCGSVWACPVCSAKIMMQRREDLAQGLGVAKLKGMHAVMITLTLRHKAGQALKDLWDAVSYGWEKVTSGAAWRGGKLRQDGTRAIGDVQRYGVAGYIRALEVTHGENGWHPHLHVIVLLDSPLSPEGAEALGLSMWGRWERAVKRRGFDSLVMRNDEGEIEGGLNVTVMRGRLVNNAIGDYLTKSIYALAAEATLGPISKEGRMGNRTPMQILRAVVEIGDADDLDLWHEYERVSVGRKAMTWSKGLRDLLALEVEKGDEEIAAEEVGTEDDTVLILPAESWRTLRDNRLELKALRMVEHHGPGCLRPWLTTQGIAWLERDQV